MARRVNMRTRAELIAAIEERYRACGKRFSECSDGLPNRVRNPSDLIGLVMLWPCATSSACVT